MNVGVFIGRFQPLHIGHLSIIAHKQQKYEHIIIAVGSVNLTASRKNPFGFLKRKQWIEHSFSQFEKPQPKLNILPLNDYDSDEQWKNELKQKVAEVTNKQDKISLVGYEKDDSSYYLKSFPHWGYDAVEQSINIDATTIRNAWFDNNLSSLKQFLPSDVYADLLANPADYNKF